MSAWNTFIVDIQVKLLRHDKIVPLSEDVFDIADCEYITEDQKQKLKIFGQQDLERKEMFMWLYYTGELPGTVFQVLKKKVSFANHIPMYNIKAKYILPRKCTKEELKEKVLGIFFHWSRAGYISYQLPKFKIVSRRNNFGDLELGNDTYFNLG